MLGYLGISLKRHVILSIGADTSGAERLYLPSMGVVSSYLVNMDMSG